MSAELAVLIPLLVVPVVLLLAFAGCTSFDAAPSEPSPPTTPEKPTEPVDPEKPKPTGPVYGTVVRQTAGLVAHWRLDETAGPVLRDSGPDAATGKFNGTYRTSGVTLGRPGALSPRDTPDLAAEFTGSGGAADVPFDARLNLQPDLAFTVEAWVKPADVAAVPETQTLVSSRQPVSGGWHGFEVVLLRPGGASPAVAGRIYAGGTGPRDEIVAEADGNVDDWRHVVFVYDNGRLELTVTIIGGPKVAPAPVAGRLYRQVTAGTFRLGAGHQNAPTPVNHLAGLLDEVAFYNVPLGPGPIAAHIAAATP